LQLLIFSSLTRVTLQGETPVGMIMVSETAPTKWRATALGGLVGGYPFGYMNRSLHGMVQRTLKESASAPLRRGRCEKRPEPALTDEEAVAVLSFF
jgi:hypothetical protein